MSSETTVRSRRIYSPFCSAGYEYAQALDPADKTPTLEKEQLLKYLQTRASHLLKETAKDRAARKGRA